VKTWTRKEEDEEKESGVTKQQHLGSGKEIQTV
jgi:hypothetical protein